MIDWIRNLLLNKYLQSAVRHLLGMIAGVLAGQAIDPEILKMFVESGQEVIPALVILLGTQAWSWIDKAKK